MIVGNQIASTPAARAGNPWAAVMPLKTDGSAVIEETFTRSAGVASAAAPAAQSFTAPSLAPKDFPMRFAAGMLGAAAPGVGAPLQLVLLGGKGSTKSAQAAKIAQEYNVPHISVGKLLRDEIASGSKLGKQLESSVKAGNSSPAGLVNQIIEKRFESLDVEKGFVLDGYSKDLATMPQIEDFLSRHSIENLKVIELEANATPCDQLPVCDFFRNRGDYFTVDANGGNEDTADNLGALVVNFASNPIEDYNLAR